MNKMIAIIFLAIALGMVFSSCSKKNDDGGGGSAKSYIKMKVNGIEWYDERVATAGISTIGVGYNLSIVGTNDNFSGAQSGLSIILTKADDFAEGGTYKIKDFEGGASITKVHGKTYTMSNITTGVDFTIRITSIKSAGSIRKVSGTFSGTLKGPAVGDIATVTDGEFVCN